MLAKGQDAKLMCPLCGLRVSSSPLVIDNNRSHASLASCVEGEHLQNMFIWTSHYSPDHSAHSYSEFLELAGSVLDRDAHLALAS